MQGFVKISIANKWNYEAIKYINELTAGLSFKQVINLNYHLLC
jgi:hypothetical protein